MLSEPWQDEALWHNSWPNVELLKVEVKIHRLGDDGAVDADDSSADDMNSRKSTTGSGRRKSAYIQRITTGTAPVETPPTNVAMGLFEMGSTAIARGLTMPPEFMTDARLSSDSKVVLHRNINPQWQQMDGERSPASTSTSKAGWVSHVRSNYSPTEQRVPYSEDDDILDVQIVRAQTENDVLHDGLSDEADERANVDLADGAIPSGFLLRGLGDQEGKKQVTKVLWSINT